MAFNQALVSIHLTAQVLIHAISLFQIRTLNISEIGEEKYKKKNKTLSTFRHTLLIIWLIYAEMFLLIFSFSVKT